MIMPGEGGVRLNLAIPNSADSEVCARLSLKDNIEPVITLYKLWGETASYRSQKQCNN